MHFPFAHSSGQVDANLEGWNVDYTVERVDDYSNQRKTVRITNHDFQGRIGLYVPTSTTSRPVHTDVPTDTCGCEEELITDFWRTYQGSESVMEIFKFSNLTKLDEKKAEWSSNCPSSSGCPEESAEWKPPQCAGDDHASCDPIFHVLPPYGVGWVEQVVRNLNLNFTVIYAGWDLFDFVDKTVNEGQPVMFYLWRPHEFLTTDRFTRVAFPESNAVCALLLIPQTVLRTSVTPF